MSEKDGKDASILLTHNTRCPTCLFLPYKKNIGRLIPVVFEYGWQCSVNKAHVFSALTGEMVIPPTPVTPTKRKD